MESESDLNISLLPCQKLTIDTSKQTWTDKVIRNWGEPTSPPTRRPRVRWEFDSSSRRQEPRQALTSMGEHGRFGYLQGSGQAFANMGELDRPGPVAVSLCSMAEPD